MTKLIFNTADSRAATTEFKDTLLLMVLDSGWIAMV